MTRRRSPLLVAHLVVLMAATLLAVPGSGSASAADTPVLSRCTAEVDGLFPHGPAVGRDAVLMIHGWTGSPDAWTGDISHTVTATNEPIGRSLVDQVERFGETDVWLLDYHEVSTRWVTDPAVGGRVAAAIDCLAQAYERPVGIIAHSMGGLAVRHVASENDRAERIAGVVTFGTPHAGSDLGFVLASALGLTDDPSALDLIKPVHTALLRACGWLTSMDAGPCEPLVEPVKAFRLEAAVAMTTGSEQLDALPPWPPEVPTHSLAGEMVMVTQASQGLFYQDLGEGRLGDVLVSSRSATAEGSSSRTWECRHHLRFGRAVGDDLRELFDQHERSGVRSVMRSPCLHTNLTQAVEITNEAIWFLHQHLKGGGSGSAGPLDDGAGEVSEVVDQRPAGSPMMLVLDVSGSMDNDDGTGTIKIDGAKTALADTLHELPDGQPLGVRTYPDPAEPECSDGRTLQRVAPLDATRTTALIDGVTTEGNTPTGPALLAAVEELRAAGYDSGELLLVSDGESNCGQPPCEIARSIVDEGFDLSANTLGFQTSADGEEELRCISDATRGRYFSADDSDELTEQMVALSGGLLEVDVAHPDSVPAGLRLPLEVTVSNEGGRLAQDVELSLGFEEGEVVPAVRPPRYRLGNIPPGESVTRTWDVVAGSRGDAGGVLGRLTAWGPDLQAVSATAEFEVTRTLPRADQAGELLRRVDEQQGRVAILGDSFSAGEGAADYLPGTDDDNNRCHRSELTYAVSLFGTVAVDIIACSGAVIQDLYSPQADQEGTVAQLRALDELDETPSLALLTLGGNDIGFKSIIRRCLLPDDCTDGGDLIQDTLRDIELLIPQLERAYRGVAQALDGQGMVAVLAYPQVLPYGHSAACEGLNTDEVVFANRVAHELNAVVERAVGTVWDEGYDVVYVPQSAGAVRPSNTACHPDPYINPIDLLLGVAATSLDWASGVVADLTDPRWSPFEARQTSLARELLHPNASGYEAMTYALVRWSQVTDVDPDGDGRPPTPTDRSVVAGVVGGTVGRLHVVDLEAGGQLELDPDAGDQLGLDVRQGDRLEVVADGYAPGSEVTIVVESRRTALGSVRADEDGAIDTVVHVPADAQVGSHTLIAQGVTPEAEPHRPAAAVAVHVPAPGWVRLATIGAATSALLGLLGLGWLLWSRRRGREEPT